MIHVRVATILAIYLKDTPYMSLGISNPLYVFILDMLHIDVNLKNSFKLGFQINI